MKPHGGGIEKSPRPVNSHLTYILTYIRHESATGGKYPLATLVVFYTSYVSEMLQRYKIWGSRNLVGIAIQLSDSEEEKLFVHDSMQVSPE